MTRRTWRAAAAAAGILVLGLASGAASRAQGDAGLVRLRVPEVAGVRWAFEDEVTFDWVEPGDRRNKAEKFQLKSLDRGKVHIQEVAGDGATVVKVRFAKDCQETVNRQRGNSEVKKASYAGKAVTVRRAGAQITIDASETIRAGLSTSQEDYLRGFVKQMRKHLPDTPMRVGDTWRADRRELSEELTAANGDPTDASFDGRLAGVRDVDGMRVADIDCTLIEDVTTGQDRIRTEMSGRVSIDLASGYTVESNLTGNAYEWTPAGASSGTATLRTRARPAKWELSDLGLPDAPFSAGALVAVLLAVYVIRKILPSSS